MTDVDAFVELRPRLFGIAYRMLGSVSDAEDVVQDAFLRWQRTDPDSVDNADAFLTTVVVRLSLDELRSSRKRREEYVGPWLPEPLLVDEHDPAAAAELADSLSMAFLVVLEALAPAERAAFLLHEVFGYDYDGIAAMLGKQPAACRQLVSRARRRVGERRQRYDADLRQGRELAQQFLTACATGDVDGVMALLSEDATLWTDGGGVAKAARRVIAGSRKVARFLVAITPTLPPTAEIADAVVNGQPGTLISDGGEPIATIAYDIRDGEIVGIHVVNNPEKLTAVRVR
ncbi:MAG TPA: RNA polymerase sigma-70 factor [Mycobacteriales bacterium]|nr:RNA polymerase sigma-70 factor [Mycobacteriales bacterium]